MGAPTPELTLERVAVGQGGLEASRVSVRETCRAGVSLAYSHCGCGARVNRDCYGFCYSFSGQNRACWGQGKRAPMLGKRPFPGNLTGTAAPAVPTLDQESPGSSPGGAIKSGNDFGRAGLRLSAECVSRCAWVDAGATIRCPEAGSTGDV